MDSKKNAEFEELVASISHTTGLDDYEICKRVGRNPGYIAQLRSRMKKGEEVPQKFIDLLRLSFATDGDLKTQAEKSIRKPKVSTKPYMVPLVSVSAQAGYSKSYSDSDFINSLEEYPIVPGVDHRGAVWRYFQVEGDSMLPLFNNGDYVLGSQVIKDDWAELKDFIVYIVVTENLVTIKYVAKRNKELILIPRNEEFDQKAVQIEDVKEIWKFRRYIGWNASNPVKMEIKI